MSSNIFSVTITTTSARKLREIPLSQVENHHDVTDCWVVIYDRVYDVTKFIHKHPGGVDMLLDYAGRDASIAFRSTRHSPDTINNLRTYCIGELPLDEQIFRNPNGLQLSEIPI